MIMIGMLGYGDRCPQVQSLIAMAMHSHVKNLLIFWNQPSEKTKQTLDELKRLSEKIIIETSHENLGSAGGYAQLIMSFRDNYSTPYLLLLDDDLRPSPGCIEALLQAANNDSGLHDKTLFLAYRPMIPELADLVKHQKEMQSPRPGCCVGFHFANLFKKPSRTSARRFSETGLINLDLAPWGGLLIPRISLSRLGLPREDFFMYAEDTELTYRFTLNGGKILLVPSAEIIDLEPVWNTTGGAMSNLRRRIMVLPEMKVFHEVRNRNFIARHYFPGLLPTYWLNKFLFLLFAYFIGIANRRFSRVVLIHQAINAGEKMAAKEACLK